MTLERPWHRTHLAVPRADDAVLTIPAFEDVATFATANASRLAGLELDVQGRPLSFLRREARREAVRLARSFTKTILGDEAADADPAAPLIVPGHQPALYHPGVWAKNFAAAGVAKRAGGSVLNLIVDNDIYARAAIDAPAGSSDQPRREAIAFDARQRSRPWERATIQDAATFRTFGERVAAHMKRWKIEPIAELAWRGARERFAMGGSVPECLSAARHSVENAWGLHNLELPMSRLCETEPFLRVAAHLLAQLPRFNDVYNGVLREYRSVYHIKSRNHPVPELEQRDEWLEAPFWVWRDEAPHRRRVFARQAGQQVTLADDAGHVFATLPLSPNMDACCAVEVLKTLPQKGIRFRTRALTTTLFARVFLADAFVHGIGGAKYDEMTDRIIARFFGIEAPEYATVSASVYLPFASPFNVTSDDERRLVGLLRDLEQNPQRHLTTGVDSQLDALLREKSELIAEQDRAHAGQGLTRSERRSRSTENGLRFRRLQEITTQLAMATVAQRERVANELREIRRERKANQILANREFSFVLYPEAKLRPFLERLAVGG